MRTWLSHGAAAAVFGITICHFAASVSAEPETPAPLPSGEAAAEAPLPSEPDPFFDDAFDAELEFSSNMDRADPFEKSNRKVFRFNQGVKAVFFDPVTRGYRFLVPRPARRAVRRAFLNLNSPKVLVNDLLQLRFKDAGETLGRLVLNSTLGVGGLFDAGEAAGWKRHDSDFGQTLAKWGVASGPYLVIPVFGPSTVRDGLGSVVDLAFQPLAYILGPTDLIVQVYIGGGNGLVALDANRDRIEALEESSIDFYAAMRSAYLQSRRAKIEGLEPLDEPAAVKETDIAADLSH